MIDGKMGYASFTSASARAESSTRYRMASVEFGEYVAERPRSAGINVGQTFVDRLK